MKKKRSEQAKKGIATGPAGKQRVLKSEMVAVEQSLLRRMMEVWFQNWRLLAET
jgi:hypothetical protein